ncbi:MAG: hypothetical protein ACK5II_08400 [Paracoccus sp. (in: a-proteobacteria)]
MILLAAVLSAGLADVPADLSLDALMSEIDHLVLTGRKMPRAFLLDVERLPDPAGRMLALIYLRRAGLLTGSAVSLDQVVFQLPGMEQYVRSSGVKNGD